MIKDILKYVYDKNGGHTTRDKVGEVLYNRGVINAIFDLEAIRTAQGKFGNKPLKGEQVQWGYEHLEHHARRGSTQLGADGLMVPIQLSCANHEGNGQVRIQQWDGKNWNFVSDWIQPDRDDADRDVRGTRRSPTPRRRPSPRATARRRCEAARHRLPSSRRLMTEPAALLAVNNIEVIYNHVILVLKGVSLAVPSGGIVALLGANGAGKTTTLKAISNLLRAERGEVTKGSITFAGERIDRLDAADVVAAA